MAAVIFWNEVEGRSKPRLLWKTLRLDDGVSRRSASCHRQALILSQIYTSLQQRDLFVCIKLRQGNRRQAGQSAGEGLSYSGVELQFWEGVGIREQPSDLALL